MNHEQALAMARFVVDETSRPVSVFVADTHGEVVVAITMQGAAHDTRLNAQRKAYTAARSHLHTSGALGESVRDEPVDRASFDPFFTFFRGGVAVFEDGTRVGAVAVSGLTGEEDEDIALRAIERAGLSGPPAAG
jgi:glc operon protein GlcG